MKQAIQRMGHSSRPLLVAISFVIFVASLGLVLPKAKGFLTWLTPFSAAVLAVMMGGSITLHLRSREKPMIFADVILCVLCAFVAYGRWFIAP